MSQKLVKKVAVITGATSGLALATAKLFVQEGAFVFITGRRQKELDAAVASIGSNVIGVKGDAGSLSDLDHLFEVVRKEAGHIDILHASAGLGDFGAFLGTIAEEAFDKVMNVNVRGTLFTVQKALPLLREGGSIILTGSIAGQKGLQGMGVYNASKAAVRSFARTWANELVSQKIRVNVVSPGPIDTGVFADVPQEMRDQFAASVPMKRFGRSEEVAKAVLFLASDDSSFITGTELFVDGGSAQI